MLVFVHGIFAAAFILFVLGALFFDFIAILRPPRFYARIAFVCALFALLSFVALAGIGGILASHVQISTAAGVSQLHRHIIMASETILLLLLTWLIRLTLGRYRFRMILYFVLEIAVLAIAILTAHYGTLVAFLKP
ncbi:hypothetical protein LSG31_00040 [Fodinisporobacter ferrooxydans]|uniref:DUF2231 domain-containing protein n=1 Tax=Fodinisporobacter ferrooxydans TaxID=2901836 RepID=A0ABY4CJS6_9BACL|nr:hypothetical protein LSG31_00040 [Alicyclobacillaceae bacterium MYW30-H2]